jgi:pilus assembly protein CpaB
LETGPEALAEEGAFRFCVNACAARGVLFDMLKGKAPLIFGVVLAVLAFIVGWSGLQKQRADVRKGWNLMPVVVAGVDISEGTVVTIDMISQRSIPDQFVTSSVIKPDSANYVVGQKVMVALQAGDPLLWSQFETTRANERLSNTVMNRTRAVTIEARSTAAVGGFVRPNDHVDVIGTFKDPQRDEMVAFTLLQNVIVLATGKITGNTNVNLVPENERAYGNVTLLVVPQEGEILTLAQELGSLSLMLRNANDLETIDASLPTSVSTLFDGEKRKRQKEIRDTITIIRGNVARQEKE